MGTAREGAVDPSSVTLLVIAKEPRPGRVKTRLCPPCSADQAAAIAAAALADTLDAVARTPARRRVCVLDGSPGAWLPAGFDVVEQVEGGLDRRLDAAFAAVEGPALLVGMDTPQLRAADLTRTVAMWSMADTDAVVGPATDGGYWCIGFRSRVAGAFDGVPMSESTTCDRQLERLADLGLDVALVDEFVDVDKFADAVAVAADLEDGRFRRVVGEVAASVE